MEGESSERQAFKPNLSFLKRDEVKVERIDRNLNLFGFRVHQILNSFRVHQMPKILLKFIPIGVASTNNSHAE